MKIIIKAQGNIYNLMRQAGYFLERPASAKATAGKKEDKELVFSRPLSGSGSGYPRFHIYIKEVPRETPHQNKFGTGQALEINLHLDQKKPVYRGATAHGGEYEGKIVEKEAERIKQILGP